MELTFEEPPEPKRNKKSEWDEVREKLIANTGQWPKTASYGNRGTAHAIAERIKQSMGAWRGHRWDAAYRTVDGTVWLYVRHLGVNDGGVA